jgi:outer membrane protein OmpA-like peptidoglycan-associated protein
MRSFKYVPICVSLLVALAAGGHSAVAQTQNLPWVQMESMSFNLGIGGQSGDGVLHLPNLGTNCDYPFKVEGFGAGIQVGISKVSASGPVANMARVSDLSGDYGATEGEVTLLAGAGGSSLKNRRNNVVMNLKSETQGIGLGFGAKGLTIKVADTPVNAPRAYVVDFGFNKTWVNQQSRAALDPLIRAWKCRYANIWLFGHTDTVGKEDTNLELSDKRVAAVREYLLGAGIVPTRVFTKAQGEDPQLARTANNVRLRTNRAVVIVVQE